MLYVEVYLTSLGSRDDATLKMKSTALKSFMSSLGTPTESITGYEFLPQYR